MGGAYCVSLPPMRSIERRCARLCLRANHAPNVTRWPLPDGQDGVLRCAGGCGALVEGDARAYPRPQAHERALLSVYRMCAASSAGVMPLTASTDPSREGVCPEADDAVTGSSSERDQLPPMRITSAPGERQASITPAWRWPEASQRPVHAFGEASCATNKQSRKLSRLGARPRSPVTGAPLPR